MAPHQPLSLRCIRMENHQTSPYCENLVSGASGTYWNEKYKTYSWIPGAIGHFAKVKHPNHPKRLQKNQNQKHRLRQNRSTTSLGPLRNPLESSSKSSQMFLQIVSPKWLSLRCLRFFRCVLTEMFLPSLLMPPLSICFSILPKCILPDPSFPLHSHKRPPQMPLADAAIRCFP